ncbi:lysosomal Pro-X carboxypeptidase-like [Chlorella sorokiniana]|uniref:Lysosomal Pro-X carboxypeptidase-like n=1 Tax=Chlorella sorokiniana TaxID=3076 RepID=A0A2P6TML0_CHLSO|nr:lysosomal Pro-X carboxypeptidase-like [Chlorella sorokiniana]|eukprot:PRW45573.1 lysosomal Pro-X carboxypeptidase-like [Chlorella sorokiniana]
MRAALLLALALCAAGAAVVAVEQQPESATVAWTVLAEPHDADAAVGSSLPPAALLRRLQLAADPAAARPEIAGPSHGSGCGCHSFTDAKYDLWSMNSTDPAKPQVFFSSYSYSWPAEYTAVSTWPTPDQCCDWCRNSWDCAYWEHLAYSGSTQTACFFYDKRPPMDPVPQDYDAVYAKTRTDPSVTSDGNYNMLAKDTCSVCSGDSQNSDLGCRALYGAPRVQPLNDYRLIYFVKKCLDAYIAKYRVMAACGDDVRLYASPLIKFSKACTQLVSGRTWYLSVRAGYPCFGTPRRVNGKIVGYPAWGRYRVHNLYCNIWQKAPQKGIAQPYDVNEFYRF